MSLTQEEIRGKYLKAITTAALDRFNTYFDSECYKGLKSSCQVVDDAVDLRFKSNEAFIAEIAQPIVRKGVLEANAFLCKYFENDPLVTMENLGKTPKNNADNLQIVLNANFKNTRFREECLLWQFDNFARYGTAVNFSQYDDSYRGVGLQTVHDPEGRSPFPRVQVTGRKAVCNYSIHPLNYFQDPRGNSFGKSSYQGFIDQWYVADLFRYENNDLYIQENLQKVIKDCKKGHSENFWHGGKSDVKDHTRAVVNPIRMYMLLNFDGNEEDPTIYYLELLNGELIRCHENDIDLNVVPLQVGVYIPRPDTWWGNSTVHMTIQFQNLKNWLLNAQVESTMKQMDRMILVRRGGGLNVADINNRHQFGGIVFYEGQDNPQSLMFPVQQQDTSLKDLDWLNREVNQMVQEASPVVNMQNKYNDGGMNNSTLGAAQMMAGIGEVMFNYTMRNVGYFIERISEVNAALLIQNLGDVITIKASALQDEKQISKAEILGEFCIKAESSMLINEKSERMDKSNMINQALNWQGTQNPAFQGLKLNELVKDWIRAWVGQFSDITKYYEEQQPQQQMPQQMQGMLPPPPGAAPVQAPPQMAVQG